VAEDRFDHALAFGVEPAAAVGLQNAAHEAVEAVEDDELGAGVATDDPGQFTASTTAPRKPFGLGLGLEMRVGSCRRTCAAFEPFSD
jgi:hypothetical protein